MPECRTPDATGPADGKPESCSPIITSNPNPNPGPNLLNLKPKPQDQQLWDRLPLYLELLCVCVSLVRGLSDGLCHMDPLLRDSDVVQ